MKRIICMLMAVLLLGAATASATELAVGQETGVIVGYENVSVWEGLWDGAQTVGILTPGTGVIILQRFGDMVQVFARGERTVGWVKGDFVQVDQNVPAIHTGVVISQSVSIRETPKTNAKLLATANNGTVLEILSEQDGWYYVQYWAPQATAPVVGYARTNFIVQEPAFITTTQATYVYAMPSRNAKMVGQLVEGTQLVIIGEWDDYWVVNLRSASGFIRKADVGYNQIVEGNG